MSKKSSSKRKALKRQKKARSQTLQALMKNLDDADTCLYYKDFDNCMKFAKRARKIDPAYPDSYFYIAECYFKRSNYRKVLKYAKEALPHKHKFYHIKICIMIFYSYINLEEHENALAFYVEHISKLFKSRMKSREKLEINRITQVAENLIRYYYENKSPRFIIRRYKRTGKYSVQVCDVPTSDIQEKKQVKENAPVSKSQEKGSTRKPPSPSHEENAEDSYGQVDFLSGMKQTHRNGLKSPKIGKQPTAGKSTETPESTGLQTKTGSQSSDKTEEKLIETKPTAVSGVSAEESERTKFQEKPAISFKFNFQASDVLDKLEKRIFDDSGIYNLRLQAEKISLMRGFSDLLCLDTLVGVEKYWYQIETVKKILKYFRGRALLCDEVGLGKTIEAGMIFKEYSLRGLAGRILILTPPSLVSQWKIEMEEKFGADFATTLDSSYSEDPAGFWKTNKRVVASLSTAKTKRNFPVVTKQEYDLVIVDEAHRVKNRKTLGWKLINSLKKRFILLLTATPVQNDLMEIYNLITLLSPGTLSTPTAFKKRFVVKGDPRKPKDMDRLRELLKSVMIRNTRAMVDITLPPRFASTYRIQQKNMEKEIYERTDRLSRELYSNKLASRMLVMTLLSESGSSPGALEMTLERIREQAKLKDYHKEIDGILELCRGIKTTGKLETLIEILKKSPEKKIIFTRYHGTLDYIYRRLEKEKITTSCFHGKLSKHEKESRMEYFCNGAEVLLSTEVGGEGKNLQFCNTMINFDLPWNPMQIEQRIGRIHRIGQEREVFIFNLSGRDTIEDYILSMLDKKINMFELVIGEIGMILGNLDPDKEFPDIVLDLWAGSADHAELEKNFDRLGEDLVRAKEEYLKTRKLDDKLFSEDYEV